MGELQSALDALAAEDLTSMVGSQLLERLGPLLVDLNRLTAEVTRTVRACERTGASELDGLKTMPAWLRGHAHLTPRRRPGSSGRVGRWSTCRPRRRRSRRVRSRRGRWR